MAVENAMWEFQVFVDLNYLEYFQSPKVDETKKLTVHHVSGVFLILFAGCIYGILEGLMRWCLNMRKHSKAMGVSQCKSNFVNWTLIFFSIRFHSEKSLKKSFRSFDDSDGTKSQLTAKVCHRWVNSTCQKIVVIPLRLKLRRLMELWAKFWILFYFWNAK